MENNNQPPGQPAKKVSKKVESTLRGKALKEFQEKCEAEGMKEAEAIRYAIHKWIHPVK